LAVANQKGGVGKTTTAVSLASGIALRGHAVLLIDLDPQGNASTSVGVPARARCPGTYDVLRNRQHISGATHPTAIKGLALLPAGADLVGAEVELATMDRRQIRLREAVDILRADTEGFDYIFVDCPPSLGLLTINGLAASDGVLVPLQCEFFALEGISNLSRTVDGLRRTLNPRLRIEGIVLTMFDKRNNLADLVAKDARSFFKDRVYETMIPRNVRLSEAPSHGKPIALYDPNSPGALAYGRLVDEFLATEAGQAIAHS
jgi:chromosome partitioning protein